MNRPRYEKVILPALLSVVLAYALLNIQALAVGLGLDPANADLMTLMRRCVGSAFGLCLAWLSCVLIDVFVWQSLVERRTNQAAPRLLVAMLRVVIILMAVGFIVAYVFEQPLTGMLVSSGVVGIVLGLALQRTISDFFSGIAMNVENSYRVGDWIKIDDVVGRVVEINWRATHLVRIDQVTAIVPNSFIAENKVLNYNLPRPYFRAQLPIALEYGVPIPDAKRVLLAGVRAAEGVLDAPAPDVLVTEFGNDGIIYQLRFFVANYQQLNPVTDNVAVSVNHHLYQAGLSVPFPKRDVFFAQMPPREIDPRKDRAALVGRIGLFTELSPAEITRLVEGLHERHFAAGQQVFAQGDEGESLFVVVEGLFEVRVDTDETTRSVAQLEPGQFFGEMSLLTGEHRSATVVSLTDTTVYELDRDVLAPILQQRPELAETLSRALAERRTQTQTRIEQQTPAGPTDVRRHLASDFLRRIQGFFGLHE